MRRFDDDPLLLGRAVNRLHAAYQQSPYLVSLCIRAACTGLPGRYPEPSIARVPTADDYDDDWYKFCLTLDADMMYLVLDLYDTARDGILAMKRRDKRAHYEKMRAQYDDLLHKIDE